MSALQFQTQPNRAAQSAAFDLRRLLLYESDGLPPKQGKVYDRVRRDRLAAASLVLKMQRNA